jgi:excisionase family DNA binding protein
MPPVHVREAAKLTGRDRSTITRAIARGHLSATRDGNGRYLIDPAELERAYGQLGAHEVRTDAMRELARADASCAREIELLREQLEHERGERERERRAWEDERTFLRRLVEQHSEQLRLLTHERAEPQAKRAGWWRWVIGRE